MTENLPSFFGPYQGRRSLEAEVLFGALTVGHRTIQFWAQTCKKHSWRPILRRSFVRLSLLLHVPMDWPADCKE